MVFNDKKSKTLDLLQLLMMKEGVFLCHMQGKCRNGEKKKLKKMRKTFGSHCLQFNNSPNK